MINIHIYNLKNYLSAKRVSAKYKNILAEKFFNNHYVLEIENEGDVVFNYKSDDVLIIEKNILLFFNISSEVKKTISLLSDNIQNVCNKYCDNYFRASEIAENKSKSYELGVKSKNEYFSILGILNVTKDSFSDGGKYYELDDAINHYRYLKYSGADIIDIGGESTRPGAFEISEQEELERTYPLIKEILRENANEVISIDTTKSKIAEKALKAGAKIVNDISAFEFDKRMLDVLKEYDPVYVLMHMKGTPKNMQDSPFYDDPIKEIMQFFYKKINILEKNNIKKIILDPGIGFGKRPEDNFEIINRLSEFYSIGYPVLIGLSRKRFLGFATGSAVLNRDIETIIMETLAVNNGARYIRTHNVENCNKLKILLENYNNN